MSEKTLAGMKLSEDIKAALQEDSPPSDTTVMAWMVRADILESRVAELEKQNAAMRKFVERARDDLERSICECGFHLKETDAYDSVMLALGRKAAGG